MSDWGDRIKLALTISPKKSQAGLARACKISGASVSEWLNNVTKMLDGINLVRAARYLDTTEEWIMLGRPDPKTPAKPSQATRLDLPTLAGTIRLVRRMHEVMHLGTVPEIEPIFVQAAYEIMAGEGEGVSDRNVVDFMERMHALRSQQGMTNASERRENQRASPPSDPASAAKRPAGGKAKARSRKTSAR